MAYSYVTNRGRNAMLTSAESGGWVDKNGARISSYPAHGNWFYVLILDIQNFTSLTHVNTCGDVGVTLTSFNNGYTPTPFGRNGTNFPTIEDDTNKQALTNMPNVTWNANADPGISARYMGKCDKNPADTSGGQTPSDCNIVEIFDLGGLRTSPNGQPFTITNIATALVSPAGEP